MTSQLGEFRVLEKTETAITLTGRLSKDAEFFQDHFPDFPILPGVLALEILKRSAEIFLQDKRRFLKEVSSAKFSSYLAPGDAWESRLEKTGEANGQMQWQGSLKKTGALKPAVTAKFILKTVEDLKS